MRLYFFDEEDRHCRSFVFEVTREEMTLTAPFSEADEIAFRRANADGRASELLRALSLLAENIER